MNVYGTEQIRNVVLLGHGGAGKTTVAEALALITGMTTRMGKVPDGNTISDYDKEEIKRQFSISTTLIPLEYAGEDGPIKINLLDTPGAAKEDSYKKIRGNSYGMWIATEINLHHDNTIKEAFNRQLAAQRLKVFWDLNPAARQ